MSRLALRIIDTERHRMSPPIAGDPSRILRMGSARARNQNGLMTSFRHRDRRDLAAHQPAQRIFPKMPFPPSVVNTAAQDSDRPVGCIGRDQLGQLGRSSYRLRSVRPWSLGVKRSRTENRPPCANDVMTPISQSWLIESRSVDKTRARRITNHAAPQL